MADRYVVIGDPIDHSLSPSMQNAAFERAGVAARYAAMHVTTAGLEEAVGWLRDSCRGFNVTVPHKRAMLRHLDSLDDTARLVGAVNTVLVSDGRMSGFNTDSIGFHRMLETYAPRQLHPRAVLFGAGGAARAVLAVLQPIAGRLLIANRSVDRARRLAETARGTVEVLGLRDRRLRDVLREADLVVNASTLGMGTLKHLSPLPPGTRLRRETVVLDLVYGGMTPLLRTAREAGCVYADGIEMLVQQGAESFRLWTKVEPDVEVMRAACLRHLRVAQPC